MPLDKSQDLVTSLQSPKILVPVTEHSVLGPSGSKRWMVGCPGSVNASKGAKDDESIYAASGSATHYLSELARKGNKPTVDWIDRIFVSGKFEFVVDEARAASAQEFVDWCEELPGEVLVEQRINYSKYFSPEVIAEYGEAFGTLDDARLVDKTVTITDLKDGQGVQEFATDNSQLKLQALGVYEDFGYLYEIEGFNLRICQPRLDHKDEWYISLADLLEWAKSIRAAGEAVSLGIDIRAGDWCKFCRIRKKCAVRANQATQVMLEEGEFEDLDNLDVHAMRAQNAAKFIDNDKLGKILPALSIFKAWIKDMERRAIGALLGKESVGDWGLVEERSNRRVINEAKWAEKLASLGIDPYQPRKTISVAVAEGTLGKKEFGRRFKKGEDWHKPPGKPTLSPPGDKRPRIAHEALAEFSNLDSEDD